MSLIREKYNALKLQALDTVEISNAEWTALEAGNVDPLAPAYRDVLPIVVAQFRQAADEEIMAWARRQEKTEKYVGDLKQKAVGMPTAFDSYKTDVAVLDQVLWGINAGHLLSEMGKFTAAIASDIHEDSGNELNGRGLGRMYLTRLGALPPLCIRRAEMQCLPLPDKERAEHLIARAGYPTDASELRKIKQELMDMGILKPMPLGAVALIAPRMIDEHHSSKGTLHCSSDPPIRRHHIQPAYSAHFRYDLYTPVSTGI